jgi:hypothetical protein
MPTAGLFSGFPPAPPSKLASLSLKGMSLAAAWHPVEVAHHGNNDSSCLTPRY